MTDAERREAARQFYNKWAGKGKEDESTLFANGQILSTIFGIAFKSSG